MTLQELLQRQQRQILALDREALSRIAPILQDAREQLAESLQELENRNRGNRYTAVHQRATMVQVEAALDAAGNQLRNLVDDSSVAARRQITQQLAEQANLALAGFGQAQPLDLDTASSFLRPDNILLERSAKYSANWTAAQVTQVKRILATEILKKSSVDDVVRRLVAPNGPMAGQNYQARRLVLTELSYARNKAAYEQIKARADRGDRIVYKRLMNILDARTAPDSLAIIALPGNLVRPVDEEFIDPYGARTFLFPPNRPNDRAFIVMNFGTEEERQAVDRETKKAAEIQQRRTEEKARDKPGRKAQSGTGVPPVAQTPSQQPAQAQGSTAQGGTGVPPVMQTPPSTSELPVTRINPGPLSPYEGRQVVSVLQREPKILTTLTKKPIKLVEFKTVVPVDLDNIVMGNYNDGEIVLPILKRYNSESAVGRCASICTLFPDELDGLRSSLVHEAGHHLIVSYPWIGLNADIVFQSRPAKVISRRANYDADEYFCEALALFFMNKEALRQYDLVAYELVLAALAFLEQRT